MTGVPNGSRRSALMTRLAGPPARQDRLRSSVLTLLSNASARACTASSLALSRAACKAAMFCSRSAVRPSSSSKVMIQRCCPDTIIRCVEKRQKLGAAIQGDRIMGIIPHQVAPIPPQPFMLFQSARMLLGRDIVAA